MKRLITPVLALAVCVAYTQQLETSNTKTLETMQKQDKAAIETLLQTYKKSLNTSDAKLAQSLYTNDGVFMPTEAPSAIGQENILKSYEFIFTQIQLNIEFYIDEITVEGDFAFAVTSSKGTTLIHATGDTIPEANRELFVFEKVNGDWKIARYMFNKTEPRQ
ncbi:MAG: SgcJ/EcaC family oxidoreductase [Cyclobacteriaceae bacterium]|nr:SgcJ/EcaC family oxidoreductase [Cyclobacteriaceae bacterium]